MRIVLQLIYRQKAVDELMNNVWHRKDQGPSSSTRNVPFDGALEKSIPGKIITA